MTEQAKPQVGPLPHEHHGRGDNPGVGGIPAEEAENEAEKSAPESSGDDHQEQQGDNPGVGGLPAESVEDS